MEYGRASAARFKAGDVIRVLQSRPSLCDAGGRTDGINRGPDCY